MKKVSDVPSSQKRFEQNLRLLQEFPWLWGIRNSWTLALDEISVAKADETLRNFMYNVNPAPGIELWAYVQRPGLSYEVIRIEWRWHSTTFADCIRGYDIRESDSLNRLWNIALVLTVTIRDIKHTKARIYRAKRGETLNAFVTTSPAMVFQPS